MQNSRLHRRGASGFLRCSNCNVTKTEKERALAGSVETLQTTDASRSFPGLSRVLAAIAGLPRLFADARLAAAEFETLSAMTDAELAEQGLDRSQIARVALRDRA